MGFGVQTKTIAWNIILHLRIKVLSNSLSGLFFA